MYLLSSPMRRSHLAYQTASSLMVISFLSLTLLLPFCLSHTHTHIHKCMRTHTHKYKQPYTHTCMRKHTRTHTAWASSGHINIPIWLGVGKSTTRPCKTWKVPHGPLGKALFVCVCEGDCMSMRDCVCVCVCVCAPTRLSRWTLTPPRASPKRVWHLRCSAPEPSWLVKRPSGGAFRKRGAHINGAPPTPSSTHTRTHTRTHTQWRAPGLGMKSLIALVAASGGRGV